MDFVTGFVSSCNMYETRQRYFRIYKCALFRITLMFVSINNNGDHNV